MSEKLNIAQAREELAQEKFATMPTPERTLKDVGEALHDYKQAYDESPDGSMDQFAKLQEALIAHESNATPRQESDSIANEGDATPKRGRVARMLGRVAAIPRARRGHKAKSVLESGDYRNGSATPQSETPSTHRAIETQPVDVKSEQDNLTAGEVRDQAAIAYGRDVEIAPTKDGFDDLRNRMEADFADEQRKLDAAPEESVDSGQLAIEAASVLGEATQEKEQKAKRKGRMIKLVRTVFGNAGVKGVNRLRYRKHKNRAVNITKLRADQEYVHEGELVEEKPETSSNSEVDQDILDAEVVDVQYIDDIPQTLEAKEASRKEDEQLALERAQNATPQLASRK